MSPTLELQMWINGHWYDALSITLLGSESDAEQAPTLIEYDLDYAGLSVEKGHYYNCSSGYPVQYAPYDSKSWPSFLLDIFPQGAALRFIERFKAIPNRPENYWKILTEVFLSPPGNIRTKPSEELQAPTQGFSREEVIEKNDRFLEHMVESGAPVSGSSGVQGAAPKFLLREDKKGKFHADGVLPDKETKCCWIVKFPRGKSERDKEILRAEKSYYDIAIELGLKTGRTPVWEGDSLFIPRFDRTFEGEIITYAGLESLYSAAGMIIFGQFCEHETFIETILQASSTPKDDVIEYITRDLLNDAMGNTDNHGRNTAFLKTHETTRLSPLYDFAPMQFDEEGVVRTTRWKQGELDFDYLSEFLEHRGALSKNQLQSSLASLLPKLEALPAAMSSHSVPRHFIDGTKRQRDEVIRKLKSFLR